MSLKNVLLSDSNKFDDNYLNHFQVTFFFDCDSYTLEF